MEHPQFETGLDQFFLGRQKFRPHAQAVFLRLLFPQARLMPDEVLIDLLAFQLLSHVLRQAFDQAATLH
jgi:hypothetical protein